MLPMRSLTPAFDTDAARGRPKRRPGRIWSIIRWAGRYPIAVAASLVLLLLVLMAAFPQRFAQQSPTKQALGYRLKPPGSIALDGTKHKLGTDQLGRDVWARIANGARIALAVGVIGVGISALMGVGLGVIAGFFGAQTDMLIMRTADIQLSFPFILLALVWAAFIGNTLPSIIVIVGVRGWADFARLVRAKALALREQEFILATRALGASDIRLILRHIVPNVLPLVLIVASLQFGRAVILESTISFLGLGIPPPAATWGGMLSAGRTYLGTAWWLTTIPGLAIMLMVLCANILGDAMRDTFDPRM